MRIGVAATKEETDAPVRVQNATAALKTAQNDFLAAKGSRHPSYAASVFQ